MRIFQSEKQVTVSIRLNAFGELFSAGEALSVPEFHLEGVAREEPESDAEQDGLPERNLWHPGGACPAEKRGKEHDGDGGDRGIDQPDGAHDCDVRRRRFSVHQDFPFRERAYSKLKGDFRPKDKALSKS